MKELSGDDKAPVLAVGDKLIVKGYNEARWQATLDEAGYPKTQLPRRTAPAGRAAEAPPPATTAEAPRARRAAGPRRRLSQVAGRASHAAARTRGARPAGAHAPRPAAPP